MSATCWPARRAARSNLHIRYPGRRLAGGDRHSSEFELALVNLVVNARDAMPDGGAITVSAENVTLRGGETVEDLRGEFVALTVSDTGTGIPPNFWRRSSNRSSPPRAPDKGTGLGLSQAYGFAQQSGGTLTSAARSVRARRRRFICRAAAPPLPSSPPKRAPIHRAAARPCWWSKTTRT